MKRIFILENTEIWWHLALSTFLTNLLSKYQWWDDFDFNLICWKIENESEISEIKKNISKIFTTQTWLYSIKDNILFSWRAFKMLVKEHNKQKINIVHCFYPNSSLFAGVLFKILISWKVRLIYDVRSPWIEMSFANKWISRKKMFIKHIMHLEERILTKFVNHFVFITEWTKDYYGKRYHIKLKNNYSVIPSWVDVAKFNVSLSTEARTSLQVSLWIDEKDIIIGYIGNMSSMRELPRFIEDNLQGIQQFSWKFLFIGDGNDVGNIKDIITKNDLWDKFIFLDKMPQSEVIQYIQLFDYWLCHLPNIFVFRNSFPLKVLEYLAAGKKILVSDIKTHREIRCSFPNEVTVYDTSINYWSLNKLTIRANEKIWLYDRWTLTKEYFNIYKKIA